MRNFIEKNWTQVNLKKRVFDTQLPCMEIIDLKNETKKGNISPISERLEEEIKKILDKKKQAVLFLNKRGVSGSTLCKFCGHKFECPNCSMKMKLHYFKNSKGLSQKFLCHICGHIEKFNNNCPQCGEEKFVFKGWGTQSVEEFLYKKFSKIKVLRADADTISKKRDFENLLENFHAKKADVLLGTQMIAKGLDFENVELVGVILADVGLHLPDFRAEERTFQLLTQVAGRAGRRKNQGKIIIQTYSPEDEIFNFVKNNDVENFIIKQMEERKKMYMPPFSALAKINFNSPDKVKSFQDTQDFFIKIKKNIVKKSKWQCQWAPAFFFKKHNKYFYNIFLRSPEKKELINFLKNIEVPNEAKIDINPASLL